MATKLINGSYPGGYYLNPSYTKLDIGTKADVGGAGITTANSQASQVNNEGDVAATGVGVSLSDGGRVINGSLKNLGATISGTTGLTVDGVARVTNYATIASSAGSAGTALSFSSSGDVLVEETSGMLSGAVDGGGGTLILASGSSSVDAGGTISGIGGSITGFGTIEVAAGAGWNFVGDNTIDAGVTLKNSQAIIDQGSFTNEGRDVLGSLFHLSTGAVLDNAEGARILLTGDTNISPVVGDTGTSFVNAGLLDKTGGAGVADVKVALDNTGTVIAGAGTLELGGAVTGTGIMHINDGATLEFGSSVAPGSKVEFEGSGTMEVNNMGAAFNASVLGFGTGDTLNLRSVHFGGATKLSYAEHRLTVSNGSRSVSLTLFGQYAAAGFSTSSDGQGGTDVTYSPTPSPALATPLMHGH